MKCIVSQKAGSSDCSTEITGIGAFLQITLLLVLLLSVLMPAVCEADELKSEPWYDQAKHLISEHIQISGWLETINGTRLYSHKEVITSRIQARVEAAIIWSSFYGFISIDAEKNWVVEDNTRLAPREVWLEYTADNWSLRMGRQLITWGKADGLRVTDNICPVDYTDFINRTLDDIRIPVTAALLRISGETLVTELIWIPEFRPAVFPDSDAPWGTLFTISDSPYMRVSDTDLPDPTLENSEFGVRTAGYFSNIDVSASLLYTWDDVPVYDSSLALAPSGPYVAITPKHKRMTVFGLDISIPWEEFVFRAEGALFWGRHLTTSTPGDSVVKKNVVKWLFGVDWSPGDDWTVTAQIYDEQILDYESKLNSNEHRHIGTLNVSKKLINQTLTVSNMIYVMPDDEAWANRFQVEYSIMDGISVSTGLDYISGGDGIYKDVEKNSQIWVKLKYSF